MTLWKSEHGSAYGVTLHSPGKRLDLPFLIAVGTAPGLLLVGLVPLHLVLPALSIVSFAVAVVIALWAYRRGVDRQADGITFWDVAGLFAVIWVGAGMLSVYRAVTGIKMAVGSRPLAKADPAAQWAKDDWDDDEA